MTSLASRCNYMIMAQRREAPAPVALVRIFMMAPGGGRARLSSLCARLEDRFRQEVIDDFADTYLSGETPIPCVKCNQTAKFRDLLARARDLQADALATGHYIQRVNRHNCVELHRGTNHDKDQSYFLFRHHAGATEFSPLPREPDKR